MIPAGGAFLLSAGFSLTRALDVSQGHPGTTVEGRFNPAVADAMGRFGFDLALKEYLPEQNAGAHARARADGLRQSDAPALLPQVARKLGFTIAPDAQRDAQDLTMLVGATQWVLDQALRFGLVSLPEKPPAPPVLPPSPPVAPPSQPSAGGTGLRPLSPASVRVEELRSMATAFPALGTGPLFVAVATALSVGTGGLWPSARPFAIEALRFYRLARKRLGDVRDVPAEDW